MSGVTTASNIAPQTPPGGKMPPDSASAVRVPTPVSLQCDVIEPILGLSLFLPP